ncbi:MAG TPA: hypothetical protein VG013_14025 [Gemmataceae bacterium]|nr:hypothetical protein [Gemmataceae bacterium]
MNEALEVSSCWRQRGHLLGLILNDPIHVQAPEHQESTTHQECHAQD